MPLGPRSGSIPDVGRRRLLAAIGWLPLALPAAWAWIGCSSGEEAAPGASTPEPDPPTPQPETGTPAPEPAAEAPAGSGGPDALVTEIEAMEPMVEALQYVNSSAKPDQRCANCQLYTAETADRGTCQLFAQGRVAAEGWCLSWQKKIDG